MESRTRIGDRVLSLGALKPTGKVRLGDAVVAAASTGEWIDSDTEVQVKGRDEDRLTVRTIRDGEPQRKTLVNRWSSGGKSHRNL